MTVTFEALDMIIALQATTKVWNEYHYIRSILTLYPDGTSNQIQRRLYIAIKANYDNNSPLSLPMYFVCYGIKNAGLNDLDMSIYDWEKAYEISSQEKFTIHTPIDMNGNNILKTSHYLNGYLITNLSDKTFIINGRKRVLLPSGSIIKQTWYKSFKFDYEKLNIQIYYGLRLSLIKRFFVSSRNTQEQTFNVNLTLQNGHFRVKLINNDVSNEELDILIKYIH